MAVFIASMHYYRSEKKIRLSKIKVLCIKRTNPYTKFSMIALKPYRYKTLKRLQIVSTLPAMPK